MGGPSRRNTTRTTRALIRWDASRGIERHVIEDHYSLSGTTIRKVLNNEVGDDLNQDEVHRAVAQIKQELEEPYYSDSDVIVISSDSEPEDKDTYDQVLNLSVASSSGGPRKSGRLQGQRVPRVLISPDPEDLIREARIRQRMQSPTIPRNRHVGASKRPRSEDSYRDDGYSDSIFGGSLTPEPPDVPLETLPSHVQIENDNGANSSRSPGRSENSRDRPGRVGTSSLLPARKRLSMPNPQTEGVAHRPITRFELQPTFNENQPPRRPPYLPSITVNRPQTKAVKSSHRMTGAATRPEDSDLSRNPVSLEESIITIKKEYSDYFPVEEFLRGIGCGHCVNIFEGIGFSMEDDLDRLSRNMMDNFSKTELWNLLESKGLKLGDWWKIRDELIKRGREKRLL